MIRIENPGIENEVYFPKNLEGFSSGEFTLVLKNGIGEEFKYVVYSDSTLYHYYRVTLNLGNLPDGEYTYSFGNGEVGLIGIGKVKATIKDVEKETKKLIQYEG